MVINPESQHPGQSHLVPSLAPSVEPFPIEVYGEKFGIVIIDPPMLEAAFIAFAAQKLLDRSVPINCHAHCRCSLHWAPYEVALAQSCPPIPPYPCPQGPHVTAPWSEGHHNGITDDD